MIWLPLWPALALSAWFILALGWFTLLWRAGRVPLDADVSRRSASPLLGRFLRRYLIWVLSPWERGLARLGASPNGITAASLVTAVGAAVALGAGHFALGGWLYFLTGILDILDGRVARATGRVSQGGAYFDSVIDRYAELVVFGGLAWFYRGSWALVLVMGAQLGSVMVSYARARGEALGVDVKVGTMQRPERVFYLGLAMVLAPIVENLVGHGPLPAMPLVAAVLAWLAISTNLTAVTRIRHSLDKLNAPPAIPSVPAEVVPMRRARG
jgi:phosphatidylglycerophosphate synthase